MVARPFALTHAAGVIDYLGADAGTDYWADDAEQARWHGRLAKALGLRGEVDPAAFARLLDGRLPDGTVLGTVRDGEREHRPGTDLTLSAPKSMSVMALVANDRRLIDAHLQAVATTLAFVERHTAVTRVRRDRKTVEHVATANHAVASYLHTTARPTAEAPADPQLHNHNIVLNMTERDDGAYRSTESLHLFQLRPRIASVYHQELAFEVQRLGYQVTFAGDGNFALDCVPTVVEEAFSHRSAEIEAALESRGRTRADASDAEKQVTALATRSAKHAAEGAALAQAWRDRADALGFTDEVRRGIVAEAEQRTRAKRLGLRGRAQAADRAVAVAATKLAERDATFSAAALEGEAGDGLAGRATHQDVLAAIARAERKGALLGRPAPKAATGLEGYTTHEAVATERAMLAIEAGSRTRFAPVHGPVEAARIVEAAALAAEERGHEWNDGQRTATIGLLASTAQVTAAQGSAGTAKTSTVLKTYADAARAQGYTVRALAPTSYAAKTLGAAIGVEGETVEHALLHGADLAPAGKAIEIVDEAGMIAARTMARLLARANHAGTRLVLVGDTAQLGSVEAGRAFEQLQQAGMKTFVLDKIVRQTNPHTLAAVEALVRGDAAEAFARLDAGGGAIVEHAEAGIRRALLVRDFLKLDADERAGTIILDPTREGRHLLAESLRAGLIRDGTLGDEAVTATVLEGRDLGPTDRRRALAYIPGDVVTFRRAYPRRGVATGTGYRVAAIEGATVRLADPKGKAIDWRPASWGAASAEVFAEVEAEFRRGDRIQFTRNNHRAERRNGTVATVTAIDARRSALTLAMPDGSRQALDLRRLADRHVRQGWVQTVHAAQGATATTVLAHLESFRRPVDARALYVAVSRARDQARLYTDDRNRLTTAIGLRDGHQAAALDHDKGWEFGG